MPAAVPFYLSAREIIRRRDKSLTNVKSSDVSYASANRTYRTIWSRADVYGMGEQS